jgi:hypothetical protein
VDLFLACCLPFDRVDLVVHIFLISVKHHKVKISKDTDCASLNIKTPCPDAKKRPFDQFTMPDF